MKIKTFAILLLISSTSYSQETYLEKIIQGKNDYYIATKVQYKNKVDTIVLTYFSLKALLLDEKNESKFIDSILLNNIEQNKPFIVKKTTLKKLKLDKCKKSDYIIDEKLSEGIDEFMEYYFCNTTSICRAVSRNDLKYIILKLFESDILVFQDCYSGFPRIYKNWKDWKNEPNINKGRVFKN